MKSIVIGVDPASGKDYTIYPSWKNGKIVMTDIDPKDEVNNYFVRQSEREIIESFYPLLPRCEYKEANKMQKLFAEVYWKDTLPLRGIE